MVTLLENVAQVNSDFQAIKNKIVEKGVDVEEGTRTADYAAKVEQVYEAGKKAEYDAFWDNYQNYGNRTNYQYGAFGGQGWTDETYKPKYPVKPRYAYSIFTGCNMTEIKDVDFSVATDLNQAFYVCDRLTHLGTINALLATGARTTFGLCRRLQTIDKFVVNENMVFQTTFSGCSALENITIEGTIAQNGLSFQDSTLLTKASITSVINALSTTTSGLSVTLSKTAKEAAFTTDEWNTLVATKSNWSISLV